MSDFGLHQSQTQKLAIGPQMQQSLHILQAATMELRQLVQQEIAVNPVLELEQPEISLESTVPDDPESDREMRELSQMDEEWRDYWSQQRPAARDKSADDERWRHMMDSIVAPTTLQEHLMEQLRMATPDDLSRERLEFLIGNLNDDGFLHTTLNELSLSHGIPIDELEKAKALLIRFDPIGIGAVDLRESLLIQMERLGKKASLAYRLVEQNLDDLANKRYPQLARKLAVPIEEISRAADFIGTLDPHPASRFAQNQNHFVTPDVIIEKDGGEWVATMVGDDLPHLRISNAYKDMLADPDARADVREYIREKIKGGKFLIRSIHQRQATIHKIAQEIIKHQHEFFDKGSSFLRPLNMAQVAEAVGVHETTVSRAISGKFMATPHGVFEMRYFFTQGLKTEGGEDLSNTSVKNAIAELISTEQKRKPLSDDKLTKLLNEKGIKVARRTVAKYREALNILPSHLRKSFS
jgi:RNA polymerase sigma-54 factor